MMDFAGKYKWLVLPPSSSSFFFALRLLSSPLNLTTPRPPKREAWNKVKGLSTEEAKSKYVEHFLAVLDRAGGEESEALKAQVCFSSSSWLWFLERCADRLAFWGVDLGCLRVETGGQVVWYEVGAYEYLFLTMAEATVRGLSDVMVTPSKA